MRLDLAGAIAAVLLLGVGAQWLAWRTRFPAIIVLIVGPGLHLLEPAK
ncbi:MAG: hypothetical protein ACRETQ_08045 [Gammaproteobacteria bacterium]